MQGVSDVTAIVVDETSDLVGGGIDEEVGDDYKIVRLVEIASLSHHC